MINLNNLHFAPGSMKKKKRVARGNSGKSHGRGEKGQKARSGVSIGNRQGGQTPLERRIPKQITFFVKPKMRAIALKNIDNLVFSNLLDVKTTITPELLNKFKIIKNKEKYKIIGNTEYELNIEGFQFSEGAKKSIEEKNGKFIILGKK